MALGGREDAPSGDPASVGLTPISEIPGSRLAVLHIVAFSSGFAILAAEVLWTRLFVNFLTANVLVFATILGAFLTGIALGSFLVSRWVDRLRSLDVAVCISLLASAVLLCASALGQGGLGMLFQKIRGLEALSPSTKVDLSLACMFLVVAVPATVFGTVLPSLFRWSSRSLGHARARYRPPLRLEHHRFDRRLLCLRLSHDPSSRSQREPSTARPALRAVGCAGRPPKWLACRFLWGCPGCLDAGRNAIVRRPVYWFNGGFTQVVIFPPEQTLFLEEGIEGTVGVLGVGDVRALNRERRRRGRSAA